MGEISQEIDLALKKTSHLLSTISGERIRDEFIKGIKSAKSQKHFLTMLDKYGLFRFIFLDLNVDKTAFTDNEDYIVLIARLLKNNPMAKIKTVLNKRNYTIDEIKSIMFLISILKLSVDTAFILKKAEENANVSQDQIKAFGRLEKLDNNLIRAFLSFRLSVSGDEVMDKFNLKAGPEVGAMIQKLETDNFKKILTK